MSLRNFQIERATMLYDGGDMSARVAPDVYQAMLDDPTPADWRQRLFDTLAVMQTPHEARLRGGSWRRLSGRIPNWRSK